MRFHAEDVSLTSKATVVAGRGIDEATVSIVTAALRSAQISRVGRVFDGECVRRSGLLVYIGDHGANASATAALQQLNIEGSAGLPLGGYVLAIRQRQADGRPLAILDGVDRAGTLYGAHTMRQLLERPSGPPTLPGVEVRDWPAMPLRGVVEGFYGRPWSQQARLAVLDFLGAHKMNVYVYSPKDDPYLRTQWRDPYPSGYLADMRELVERAEANRVQITCALSPGLSICYSSDADLHALTAKLQSMWDVGVRSFAIAFDDIDYARWNCEDDSERFGTGTAAAAIAQADLVNRIQREFIANHPGADRLLMVPTEYADIGRTPYKLNLARQLHPSVIVGWTGVRVIAPRITQKQSAAARSVFGHDVLAWDNYPANDYVIDRIHLGPYSGRGRGSLTSLIGVVANPMTQAAASSIALFNVADYAWNESAYDPETSWIAALERLAGHDETTLTALRAFADVNRFSILEARQAPDHSPKMDAFRRAWYLGVGDAVVAGAQLASSLAAVARAPPVLREQLANTAFLSEVRPWLDATEAWGTAAHTALRMLDAHRRSDGTSVWMERRNIEVLVDQAVRCQYIGRSSKTVTVNVADGALNTFVNEAKAENDRWLGLTCGTPRGTTSMARFHDFDAGSTLIGDPHTFYWNAKVEHGGDYIGLDLGTIRLITEVDLMLRQVHTRHHHVYTGVMESSIDKATWTTLAPVTRHGRLELRVPSGVLARQIRYRDDHLSSEWISVHEFRIGGPPVTPVTGGPPAAKGSSLQAAADGDLNTAYQAERPPHPGEMLEITLPVPRLLSKVIVLQSGTPAAEADVQVHADGAWATLGNLTGGYTELDAHPIGANRLRLVWNSGSAAPQINEILPCYADGPCAELLVNPTVVDGEVHGEAVVGLVEVAASAGTSISGQLSIDAASSSLVVEPECREVVVQRGQRAHIPLLIRSDAQAMPGEYDLPIALCTCTEQIRSTLTVRLHPRCDDTNLACIAFGATARASSVRDNLPHLIAENAIDADPHTFWSSNWGNAHEWLEVKLPYTCRLGKVVIRWRPAYAKAYEIQTSLDGTSWATAAVVNNGRGGTDIVYVAQPYARFVRMLAIARATCYGYGIYELRAYAINNAATTRGGNA